MTFPIASHVAPLLLTGLLLVGIAMLAIRLFWPGLALQVGANGPWPQPDDEPGLELPGSAGLFALTCAVGRSVGHGFVVQVGIGWDDEMPIRPWPQYNSGSRSELGMPNVIRCVSLLGAFVNLTIWSVDPGTTGDRRP